MLFNGRLGSASWSDRAYDLEPLAAAPIEKEGSGYLSDPCPRKVRPPFEEKWQRDGGPRRIPDWACTPTRSRAFFRRLMRGGE